jgi:hypothetical protein
VGFSLLYRRASAGIFSALRRMARSHITRISALPGYIVRQYIANFLRTESSVA